MTSRVLLGCFFVCWLSFFGWSVHSYFFEPPLSQQGTPTPTPTPKVKQTGGTDESKNALAEQMLPWKDYQEALKAEREVLQQQAKDSLDRLDKLQDRIFSAIVLLGGLVLGFIYFLFGQTRKDVEMQLSEKISKTVRAQVEQDVTQKISQQIDPHLKERLDEQIKRLEMMVSRTTVIQDDLNKLEVDVRQMSSYKEREVVWFFSGELNTATNEITALQRAGFTVTPQEVKIGEPFELGKPDLVIFSYDKSDKSGEAMRRLKVIAGLMKKNVPDVWLLIHTLSNNDIGPDEKEVLSGMWYVPTNFSATLIVNAQALIRRWAKA